MDISILKKYIYGILIETINQDFLNELEPLKKQWDKVQADIPVEKVTEEEYQYVWPDDPEEDPYQDYVEIEKEIQVTQNEKKPSFTDEAPEHYDSSYSGERRVLYGQTQKEINVERDLMRLWQKHADIDFFKSNKITYAHNMVYKSAAKGMWMGINPAKPNPQSLINAQKSKQRDAISCFGSYSPNKYPNIRGQMGKGWGFIVKGHPIFVAHTDLASQTQRTATKAAREYYKSSGLPKRAGMDKVGATQMDPRRAKMMTRRKSRAAVGRVPFLGNRR